MKYVVILGDGMADEPLQELGWKTPLEYAKTPVMDELASYGEIGMVRTVPKNMIPGSDTANLSVLGYDPKIYYSGRAPLEALNIGVKMQPTDIAIRANLVTLSQGKEQYEQKRMLDHSAGEISTKEAEELIRAVQKELQNEEFQFYKGTSYRHCLIWKHGMVLPLTPPHDIRGKQITEYVTKEEKLLKLQKKSYEILKNHPINIERRKKGLNPGNSLWFWGAGTKPSLMNFEEKFHKKGSMISAVDLLKGIAVGIGIENLSVEGANGSLDTNYEGKARSALLTLFKDHKDFVYIHIEAPDEMGHQGSVLKKIKAIEFIDEKIVKVMKDGLDQIEEPYRLLILPDHPTPIALKTHTSDPVPYLLYDSRNHKKQNWKYNEQEAKKSGKYIEKGHDILKYLFEI